MNKLDWSKLAWKKPEDDEILLYAKGNPNTVCIYQHLNWAFMISGHNKVVGTYSSLTSEDFAILVGICQELVEREGIVSRTLPVKEKKSWWKLLQTGDLCLILNMVICLQ
jgi:hypothetical protein